MNIRYLLLMVGCWMMCLVNGNAQNISNKGKSFWLGYGKNTSGSSNFMVYVSSEVDTKIDVYLLGGRVLFRSYQVKANEVTLIGPLPLGNIHLDDEDVYASKSINIRSEVPINVFSHVYSSKSSGATMLMPEEAFGYDYFAVTAQQTYKGLHHSWFYVIAKENNTKIEVTPSEASHGGLAANATISKVLNKGEIYQVLGLADNVANTGVDLTGSRIKSVVNSEGNCYPIAVFSGNSRTAIDVDNGGDYIQQQILPYAAWGYKYLTTPSVSSVNIKQNNTNIYRVVVKDVNTIVKRNGVTLTGLVSGRYYEFLSNTPDFIESDRPVMVSQYMPSYLTTTFPVYGQLDPEMMILSPIEQSIDRVLFYNNEKDGIKNHFVSIVVPKSGLQSLRVDGSANFDLSIEHPANKDYQIVMKQWTQPGNHLVVCNEGFNALTYGLGDAESYGYNAGMRVNNLNAKIEVNNSEIGTKAVYTCDGTDFKFTIRTKYQLEKLELILDTLTALSPNNNIVIEKPTVASTMMEDGRLYNVYEVENILKFTSAGIYNIGVRLTAPEIEGCNFTEEVVVPLEVKAPATIDLSAIANEICVGTEMTLQAKVDDVAGYKWTLSNGGISNDVNPKITFNTAGEHKIILNTIRNADGCIGIDSTIVLANGLPAANFTIPDAICFPNGSALFTNTSAYVDGGLSKLTFKWNLGDDGASTSKDAGYVYSSIDNYMVSLTAITDKGCEQTVNKLLPSDRFVSKVLSATNFTDSTFCANNLIDFKGSANRTLTNAEYFWSLNNTVIHRAADLTYNFTETGNYQLRFWLKTGDCLSDTSSVNVSVKYSPKADFTMTDKMCLPETKIEFRNTSDIAGASGELIYHWDFGDGKSADSKDAVNNYATAGGYFVKLTVNVAGVCSSSVEKELLETVFKPKLRSTAISAADEYCTKVPVRFTGTVSEPSAQQYWQLGDGSTQNNSLTATKTYNAAGNYNVQFWAQSTDGCYSDTSVLPISIGWTPEVEAGVNIVSTIGRQISLNGTVINASSYSWTPADKLNNATILNPVTVLESDQIFYLNAVGNTGCEAYDSVLVKVYRELKVPNAFSPNGDGVNDIWYLEGLEAYPYARLQIFDRYGNIVHTTTGAQKSWDGTRIGKPLPTGVYYYILTVNENEYGILKGSVTLVR